MSETRDPGGTKRLVFAMQPQQQAEWCWAAVSASVHQYYNPGADWTQCQLANDQLGQTTCCLDGSTPECNATWRLDRALTKLGNLARWSAGVDAFPDVCA